jgi:S-DNA-T family DNA segregation ATPase FtsK/SpoIIIE
VRAWTITVPAVVVAVVWARWGRTAALAVVLAALVALAVWALRWPGPFRDLVVARVLGWFRWRTVYARRWYPAMDAAGLTRTTPSRAVYVPTVTRVRSTRVVDRVDVRLLHGHTPADIATAAESLRHVFRACRCQVAERGPGKVRLTFYGRDPLTAPLSPITPTGSPDLGGLRVGASEDGQVYRLRLAGTHLLIAGATGAGKGSVLWSIVQALSPGIASGVVRLRGADPKGGMELFPGRALFTDYADASGEEIVAMLDQAVSDMHERKSAMKAEGLRSFTATTEDPWNVIVVDELAFLTAYAGKDVSASVKAALSVLLSQGRAVGFVVIAALQDPRKEILSFRDLFPTRVALRLAEGSQVDMVLADGALALGARCHEIPLSLPGVGFVRIEGFNEPVRVRFTYLSDTDIRTMADTCPAPVNARSCDVATIAAGLDEAVGVESLGRAA